ncbi:MAG: hypothetical protein P1P64_09590 [Treponemataceae bacterium]
MKKNFMIILFVSLLFAFSCKSEPKTTQEEDVQQTEVEIVEETTSKAPAETKPVPKPKPAPKPEPKKETPKPVEKPKADPAKPVAEAELKKADGLMAQCTKLGVDKAFPKEFNSAKADFNAAKTAAKNNKYAQAKTVATKANTKFQTLLNLNDANIAKSDIVERKFEGASAKEFSNAEIAYIKALENFDKNENQALNYSKTSVQNYESVLEKGYVAWVKIAFDAATKSKANCDNIKANKAAKNEYNIADNFYKEARAFELKKNYKDAQAKYVVANEQFTNIFDKVSVLRAEAEKAMEKASLQQKISSELAAEADKILPLMEDTPEATKTDKMIDLEESEELTEEPVIENAPSDTGVEQ